MLVEGDIEITEVATLEGVVGIIPGFERPVGGTVVFLQASNGIFSALWHERRGCGVEDPNYCPVRKGSSSGKICDALNLGSKDHLGNVLCAKDSRLKRP